MSASYDPNFQPPPPPSTAPAEVRGAHPTYLRFVAIGAFVLGLIFLVGWIANFVARGYAPAAALCFVGLLLFGLSFIRLPALPEKEQPLSFLAKVTGIFYEPSRVFRNLREYPHWLGAFVLIALLTMVYQFAFVNRITPERIVDHTMDKLAESSFAPPPEAREATRVQQLEGMKNPVQRIAGVFTSFAGMFVVTAFVAALSLLGILAFGGRINFWQAMAAIVYAALPVVVIQKLLGLAILYLKSPDDLHPILNQETTLQDNLGILFSPADHPFLFVMASFIGLTALYALWLRAKGLHLGATKASSSAGWGVSIILMLLTMFLALAFTFIAPGFIA